MKKSTYFIFSLLIVFHFSCNNDDVDEDMLIARFIAIGENDFAPKSIEFQDDNTNANSYEWIFHDGTSTTSRYTTKLYEEGGEFPVKLIVRNGDEVDSTTRIITVKPQPTKLFIKKIEILDMPLTNNGVSWDASGGPDVFAKISDGGNLITTPVMQENAGTNNFPFEYTFAEPYQHVSVTSPSNLYSVRLYDKDTDADELMLTTGFRASDYMNPYQSTIEYTHTSSNTEIKLTVEWGN